MLFVKILYILLATECRIFGIVLRYIIQIHSNDKNNETKYCFKAGVYVLNLYDTRIVRCTKCNASIGEIEYESEFVRIYCKSCK